METMSRIFLGKRCAEDSLNQKQNELSESVDNLPLKPDEAQSGIFDPQLTDDININIDRMAAAGALRDDEHREKLIDEKATELANIAEAKRIGAEAQKQSAEMKKAHERAEQNAKIIEAEAFELQKKQIKAKAFFDANRAVLNIIGIREPLGYKTMTAFYAVALPLYLIFSIMISFPIAIAEFIIDIVIDTIGKISKKVTTTFLRVTTGICSLGLTGGLIVALYFIFRFLFKI